MTNLPEGRTDGTSSDEHRQRTVALIADLMELAADNAHLPGDRMFRDPSRRYCELRNEAVRLGWRSGPLVGIEQEAHP